MIRMPLRLTTPSPHLKTITDYDEVIPALSGLVCWHSARRRFVTLNANNRVTALRARAGTGQADATGLALAPPLWVADGGPGARGAMAFRKDSGLTYGPATPSAAVTRIIAFRPLLPTSENVGTLFGNTGAGNQSRIFLRSLDATPSVRHQVENTAIGGAGANRELAQTGVRMNSWNICFAGFSSERLSISLNGAAWATLVMPGFTSLGNPVDHIGCGNTASGLPTTTFDGDICDFAMMSVDMSLPAHAAAYQTWLGYADAILGIRP
jgi:hypothetical protein